MQQSDKKNSCSETDSIRSKSRDLVRELGFLEEPNPLVGVTMAQLHAMVELNARKALNASELASILRVNKSSSSRTIQKLRAAGWVTDKKISDNKRERPVQLTESGKAKITGINSVCDDFISQALNELTSAEREKLEDGLSAFVKALKIVRTKKQSLIRGIKKGDNKKLAFVITKTLAEFDLTGEHSPSSDTEVNAMYELYSKKGCSFFVVERENEICGGVGISPLSGASPEVCELKKFYLLPEARACGIGFLLLENAILAAKEHGYRRIFLRTNSKFSSAIKLFRKFEFNQRNSPLGTCAHSKCNIYFEKLL